MLSGLLQAGLNFEVVSNQEWLQLLAASDPSADANPTIKLLVGSNYAEFSGLQLKNHVYRITTRRDTAEQDRGKKLLRFKTQSRLRQFAMRKP